MVTPLATPAIPSCVFWSPNSALLGSVTGASACFVDRQTCVAHLQHIDLPQPAVVHHAMCSRAGLVVIAQLQDHQGMFTICSLTGTPKAKLRVLWQISTGRGAVNLTLSPSGLLLVWTDYGNRLDVEPAGSYWVQDTPRVQVCELATGRIAKLCRRPEVAFEWQPKPNKRSEFKAGRQLCNGLRLFWAPAGTSVYVVGPMISNMLAVRQVCLLPW